MNQRLSCIIIDDSDLDRYHLYAEISKLPSLQVIGVCESCVEAQEILSYKDVDVVFVDIEMPENTKILPFNVSSYRDSIEVGGLPVAYKITAVNIQGLEGDFSNEIITVANTIRILPPQNLKSFRGDNGNEIILTWQPSQSKVAKYLVYRFARGQEAVLLGEAYDTTLKFVDPKPNRGLANYYFIVAVDEIGNISNPSNEVYESME